MTFTPEQISKELSRIQGLIPKMLLDNVLIESKPSANLKKVAELALADPDFPLVKKQRLRLLMARGDFDKVKFIENKKISKMIDNIVNREINRSIKAHRLPPKNQIGELPHVQEIYKKVLSK